MRADLRAVLSEAKRVRCADHPDSQLYPRAIEGKATLFCAAGHHVPTTTVEVESISQQHSRGRPMPAALASNLDRKNAMSEEQSQAVAIVRATPPSIIPTGEEAQLLLKQFAGWAEGNKALPVSAAVGIHGLINMGVMPSHIYVMGGQPYVSTDGYIAHAQAVIEERGQAWGRITYTSELTKDELMRVGVEGDVPSGTSVVKATYEEREPVTITETAVDGSSRSVTRNEWVEVQTGVGVATKTEKNPVAKQHPRRMAEARATRRMLRVLAGIRYPAAVENAVAEIGEAHVAEPVIEALGEAMESVEEPAADTTETDDVVVGEVTEIEEEPDQGGEKIEPEKSEAVDESTGQIGDDITPDNEPLEEVSSKLVRDCRTHLEACLITNAMIGRFSFDGAKGTVALRNALQAGYSNSQIETLVRG